MRLLLSSAVAVAAFGATVLAAPAPTGRTSKFVPAEECRDASMQFAREGSVWQYDPVKPKKLTELPPAEGYAAVYHLDERGCMVPIKYRDVRR